MYPSAARFNHSCEPNARLSFSGGCLSIHAVRELAEGEEVLITYVDSRAGGEARRRELLGTYGFDCDCRRCGEELTMGRS